SRRLPCDLGGPGGKRADLRCGLCRRKRVAEPGVLRAGVSAETVDGVHLPATGCRWHLLVAPRWLRAVVVWRESGACVGVARVHGLPSGREWIFGSDAICRSALRAPGAVWNGNTRSP